MKERLDAVIRGRVQGVGFRWFVTREAQHLGLTGWVANEADGSVLVVAEGERADLDRLGEQLSVGPPGARVDDVSLRWAPATGIAGGFTVRSRGHTGD
jgi:acylphosphatase